MVFAAGRGTRLGDISVHTPKALLNINGKPLLWYILRKLSNNGFNKVVINVHHLAEKIIQFIQTTPFPELNISISHEQNFLADTGGGLKIAATHFTSATHVLLHNVDIISDISLNDLYNTHIQNNCLATLAVKQRQSFRYLLFDEQFDMKGWQNTVTGEQIVFTKNPLTSLAFSGIHVVSADIFPLLPKKDIFSMTQLYIELCSKYRIAGYLHNNNQWIDVGKHEQIQEAQKILNKMDTHDLH